ncbi:hypothetical protein [Marinactinospora rubrisoli]|uniref:Uncharacterized protein n=1 Tax=Marinactinospora rubrisoli TaxID=2715399 RepID=A0ABW2KQG8_9ACTN
MDPLSAVILSGIVAWLTVGKGTADLAALRRGEPMPSYEWQRAKLAARTELAKHQAALDADLQKQALERRTAEGTLRPLAPAGEQPGLQTLVRHWWADAWEDLDEARRAKRAERKARTPEEREQLKDQARQRRRQQRETFGELLKKPAEWLRDDEPGDTKHTGDRWEDDSGTDSAGKPAEKPDTPAAPGREVDGKPPEDQEKKGEEEPAVQSDADRPAPLGDVVDVPDGLDTPAVRTRPDAETAPAEKPTADEETPPVAGASRPGPVDPYEAWADRQSADRQWWQEQAAAYGIDRWYDGAELRQRYDGDRAQFQAVMRRMTEDAPWWIEQAERRGIDARDLKEYLGDRQLFLLQAPDLYPVQRSDAELAWWERAATTSRLREQYGTTGLGLFTAFRGERERFWAAQDRAREERTWWNAQAVRLGVHVDDLYARYRMPDGRTDRTTYLAELYADEAGLRERLKGEEEPAPALAPAAAGIAVPQEPESPEETRPDNVVPLRRRPATTPAEPDTETTTTSTDTSSTHTEEGTNMTTETTGLASAIAWANGMSSSLNSAVTSVEQSSAALTSGGVTGEALALCAQGQEALSQAAGVFDQLAAELTSHLQVREAYAANQGAGEKDFVTSE